MNVSAKTVLDQSPTIIFIVDLKKDTCVYVNNGITKILGYKKERFLNSEISCYFDLLHPEEKTAFLNDINIKIDASNKDKKTNKITTSEHRVKHANGEWYWMLMDVRVNERDEKGAINSLIITCVEVTDYMRKMRSYDKQKDVFIGIASHELKTPLTSIKGYTQILERIIRQMSDDRLNTYLKKTSLYINRLDSLIEDLLDVSRIQAGKLKMNLTTFLFDDLVNEGIESIQPTNMNHTIIKKGTVRAHITGDRHRLEQVFTNILSNAIKYSPESDRVIVTVNKIDGHIQVAIQDFGIGIEEKEIQKLFQRFYRIDESAQKFSGLGIGLYISKQIINRHGGQMWVESKPGTGSTFYFTIPIVQ